MYSEARPRPVIQDLAIDRMRNRFLSYRRVGPFKAKPFPLSNIVLSLCAIAALHLWLNTERVDLLLGESFGEPRQGHQSTLSALDSTIVNQTQPVPPGWACVRVERRTVVYSIHSATLRNLLRCGWWNILSVTQGCDDPDVIVLVPHINQTDPAVVALSKYVKRQDESQKRSLIVFDDAGNYGVSMLGKVKGTAESLARSVGWAYRNNTSSIVVAGMGAMGEPCRREFNLFWTFPCTGLIAHHAAPRLPDERRRFLCLGGYPRAHKVMLLSTLWARGALHQFAWSAGTPTQVMADGFYSQATILGADINHLRSYLNTALPHVFDVDVAVSKQNGASFVPAIYELGYVHLILETDYKPTRLRYTEKTIKTIYAGVPFIILASPGVLELLKSHGFLTFHPYINETYDAIESYAARSTAIADEIDRLLALSNEEFVETLDRLSVVARHNQQWLGGHFQEKAAKQSLYAFGIDDTPAFRDDSLRSVMIDRGGPRKPYNC
jgi:hypothetical protein